MVKVPEDQNNSPPLGEKSLHLEWPDQSGRSAIGSVAMDMKNGAQQLKRLPPPGPSTEPQIYLQSSRSEMMMTKAAEYGLLETAIRLPPVPRRMSYEPIKKDRSAAIIEVLAKKKPLKHLTYELEKSEKMDFPGQTARLSPPDLKAVTTIDQELMEKADRRLFIPRNIERYIRRRPGFDYLLQQLDWTDMRGNNKKRFGVLFSENAGHVVVARVDEGTLGEPHFKPWDRVCVVNGLPVRTKKRVRELIRNTVDRLQVSKKGHST